MKKLAIALLLTAASFGTAAQVTTSRYPVFESRVERSMGDRCHEVIVDRDGRYQGLSRHRSDIPFRGHYLGRGYYYNDRGEPYRHYDTRIHRRDGIVIQFPASRRAHNRDYTYVSEVCESSHTYPYRRDVLVGHRVVVRYPDGTTREHFEPSRNGY